MLTYLDLHCESNGIVELMGRLFIYMNDNTIWSKVSAIDDTVKLLLAIECETEFEPLVKGFWVKDYMKYELRRRMKSLFDSIHVYEEKC